MTMKKNCILCGKNPITLRFVKDGYPIFRCFHCLFEAAPLQQSYGSMARTYYDRSYFTGDPRRRAYADYADEKATMALNVQPMLHELLKRSLGPRLLDVGCAYGFFMEEAEKRGFQAFGIDVSNHAVARAARTFGNRVRSGLFHRMKTRFNFHVITMLDVFEHFDDPVLNLRCARRILYKGGLLVIATNDTQSLWARILGRRWHYYIPPQHLSFFSRANLTAILNREGFAIEHIQYMGKWGRLRYWLHLARAIHRSVIAEWLFQKMRDHPIGKLPIYINLFDHMVVYARRMS